MWRDKSKVDIRWKTGNKVNLYVYLYVVLIILLKDIYRWTTIETVEAFEGDSTTKTAVKLGNGILETQYFEDIVKSCLKYILRYTLWSVID